MRIERTAVIVAFDDETGEALHVNLFYHEMEGEYKPVEPSEEDCEEVRQMAAAKYGGRKVGVAALPGDALPEMDGAARQFFMNGGREALVVR